ncbi:MAG: restriction endonuclease subunit S [Ktedonobacteraceae bacterium]
MTEIVEVEQPQIPESMGKWKAYPNYKHSGVEWLGEIPEHWEVKRLKEHVNLINGYPFESELFSMANGIPLIRIRDLIVGTTQTFYSGSKINDTIVYDGDVLIGMDGDFNVCWWQGGKALLNQRLCCIRSKKAVNIRYMYYLLRLPLKMINDLTWFTTVKHLSSSQITAIFFGYPSLSEQHAITTFLDQETSKINALIAKKERLIKLLQEKRAALISHAVTKGLDPAVKMKDSGVEWLGEIPEHWEVRRLKFMADVLNGVTKGRDLGQRDTVELPYLRVANVQDGYLDLSDIATIPVGLDEIERFSLHAGDVLMNEGGDFDKLARGYVWNGEISPCLHQNHVFAVRPHAGIDPYWLSMITLTSYAKHYFILKSKQSTNLASISATNLKELPVVMPPSTERIEILSYIKDETAKIDALIAKIGEAIEKLKEYSAALISAAVTGKIDVGGEAAIT